VLLAAPGTDLVATLHASGLPPREESALADAAGSLVRDIDRAGLFNRDHKLSNVVRRPDGSLAVIDTVAIAPRRADGRIRMLEAMLREAAGTGLLPRRALRARCVIAAMGGESWRGAWRELQTRLLAAGDTPPRVDPRPAPAAPPRSSSSTAS